MGLNRFDQQYTFEVHRLRRKKMVLSDIEIKSVERKPYTPENARRLIYGGRVNTKGIIVKAYTKDEFEKSIPKCHRRKL